MPLTRYLAPLLFGLIGAGILVGLGIWQLQRLDWKESVLAQIESRIAADPEPLPQVVDPEAKRYQPVQLSGEFLPGALRVLVSQKQVGAGYRLISPFRTDEGRVVLLDRGFIPVAQKDLTPGTGPAEVRGNLHWPDDRNSSTPENDEAGNTWFARDIGPMSEALQTEPLLVVARSVTPADPAITPLPVSITGIPNDHLQYALTWFSLAGVWLVMTAHFLWRQRKNGAS